MILKKKIRALIEEVISLGPVLPGSVSKIYNVCGKKNCKCKDPEFPEKHGPYNLLSFTIGKKSSTKFIKNKNLNEVLSMQKNYQRLKAICQELPLAYLDLLNKEDIPAARNLAEEIQLEFSPDEYASEKRLRHANMELNKQVIGWREKATERTHEINVLRARINQLEKSRDSWKTRATAAPDNREIDNKKKKIPLKKT
jgi:hypothetical protein